MLKANVIGLDAYLSKLKNASKEIQAGVAGELQEAAFKFRDDAKRTLAQNNTVGISGDLAKKISAVPSNQFTWTVAAGVYYAPFIEFGTKGKTVIPAGFEDVAAEFKGYKRGNFAQFIESIKLWVKRKGIGATYNVKTKKKNRQGKDELDNIAFLIARSILRNGIHPQPFFYKQVTPVRTQLEQRVKKLLSGI
jgi:hypothetical protein